MRVNLNECYAYLKSGQRSKDGGRRWGSFTVTQLKKKKKKRCLQCTADVVGINGVVGVCVCVFSDP